MTNRIDVGMRIRHKLTGQEGNVRELGYIGNERGARIQWLDAQERRDGDPDWALLRNIDQYSEEDRPLAFRTRATARGEPRQQMLRRRV